MKHIAVYFVVMVSLCSVVNAQHGPRGTAEATVGGKKVTVEYGRAELKGRTIDSLIAQLPADRVWRTGANDPDPELRPRDRARRLGQVFWRFHPRG
jgi:hypothetical protein